MQFRGKNYKKAVESLNKEPYSLIEGIKKVKETATTKFDSSAEVHFNLNIDPKQADQALRGTITLPKGTGKKLKIAAVVSDDMIKAAKDAGADEAGLEDLIADFSKGKVDFDLIIAASNVMSKLGKAAKVLGQKGVMPNPKSGTVTNNIEKTIQEFRNGKIEYRNDKAGNIHLIFGKVSFNETDLIENLKTIIQTIKDVKPNGIKGSYIKSITICTSMGPGIRLDLKEINESL